VAITTSSTQQMLKNQRQRQILPLIFKNLHNLSTASLLDSVFSDHLILHYKFHQLVCG